MKKIIISLLSLLLVLSLTGCDDIKIRPDKPELAVLNADTAVKYVKGLYSDARKTRWMGPVENLLHLKASFTYDVEAFKIFIDADEFEKVEKNKCGFSVETFQKRIDEIFGKDRFRVQDLFKDELDDGYVMFKVNPDATKFPEIKAISYSALEVKEHYVVVERLSEYDVSYEGKNYNVKLRDLIVVYSTLEGLKVWDCQSGLIDSDLELNYFPPLPQKEVPEENTSWIDMTFTLEDIVFNYPWSVKMLEEVSWVCCNDPTMTIKAGEGLYTYMDYPKYAGYVETIFMTLQVKNYSDEDTILRNCFAWSIKFEIMANNRTKEIVDEPYRLVLANGITWGSTEEEIIEAYGEPQSLMDGNDGSSYTKIEYEYFDGQYRCAMVFWLRDHIGLYEIELKKYIY